MVEAHTLNADKESPKQKIQELDKKLEKLLLTSENKHNAKKRE